MLMRTEMAPTGHVLQQTRNAHERKQAA